MKVTNMILVLFMAFLIIGGCNNADDNNGTTQPPPAPATPTPTPEPNPCPCEKGCCDSSGQCDSGEHCMTFPLTNQTTSDKGMECTFEIKGIDCMGCCNLNAIKLKGQGSAPLAENSTVERSNSTKDTTPEAISNITSAGSGWESSWDSAFACGGNPVDCGNGDYTAVLTFEGGCPETIEICFRLP